MDGSRSRKLATQLFGSTPYRKGKRRSAERRNRRRRLGAAIQSLESRKLLTFAIDLLADVNQLGVSSNIAPVSDNPPAVDALTIGNETFFVADDGLAGIELWKTDGTEAGTTLVKDLLPGPDGSVPQDFAELGGELFFTVRNENDERDLWKSDGTEAGTVLVFDAAAAGAELNYYDPQLTASGDKLFFVAYEPSTGDELWVYDSTTGGTMLVEDINPDQSGLTLGPQELTNVNGTLFFRSYSAGYNSELWKSDGTEAGTMMVADLAVDPDDPPELLIGSYPYELTEVNGLLYFTAEDIDLERELYVSDGTMGGTRKVSDTNPFPTSFPTDLTSFNGQVFFAADGGTGTHLYKSDGNSIELVADTTNGLGDSAPTDLVVVGNHLYFAARGSNPATSTSAEVPLLTADNSTSTYAGLVAETTSTSNGTLSYVGGTRTFNTINQGGSNDGPGWVSSGSRPGANGVGLSNIAIGDLYIQTISSGELQDDFWDWTISDPGGLTNISFAGFASGNQMNNESNEGLVFELYLNGSNTRTSFFEIDGAVDENGGNKNGDALDNWYGGRDDANVNLTHPGGETITTATIRMRPGIIDNNGDFQERIPDGGSEAFIVNATLTADLGPNTTAFLDAGRELHRTDGTTTEMVRDIVPMDGSSNPDELFAAGGKLFFSADDGQAAGRELWVSDGTEAGTMMVIDARPGNDLMGAGLDGNPRMVASLGNELLFVTDDGNQDRELWISDGTLGGTSLLDNINEATQSSGANSLVRSGDEIFFAANDGINGEAVWVYDLSTGDPPTILADISPTSTDTIRGLTLFEPQGASEPEVVFFNNSQGLAGGVYVTNPVTGFRKLSDFQPIELDDDGTMFKVIGGQIYFVVNDGNSGEELWSSDGQNTASIVVDINPGSGSSSPRELTSFLGDLYVVADDGTNGRELFQVVSQGFAQRVRDINIGADSSDPQHLTVSGSRLFFSASDGTDGNAGESGRELWVRDSGGTNLWSDIRSGGGGSEPRELTDINGTLYFTADAGDGFEPYRAGPAFQSVTQIADINSGNGSSNAGGFFSALGEVYFSADNGTTGQELFKTNGTGATLVSDIQAGPAGSDPIPMYETPGGRLLINATGFGTNDREFWSTDGGSNTLQVEDLFPSTFFGSDPRDLLEVGDTLYFVADNGRTGRELFTLEQIDVEVGEIVVGGDPGQAPVPVVQRSTVDLVSVVFEGRVDVPASAVELRNRNTDTVLTSVQVNSRFEEGQTIVELTFGSGPSVIDRDPTGTTGLGNSLADGNYELTIFGNQVTSPVSGGSMAADFQYGTVANDLFFRRFGDFDGDRDVDGLDYTEFVPTFLRRAGDPNYNRDSDFDGDGDVDGTDYIEFAARFLRPFDFV